jgi:hypothetical protein
MEEKAPFFVVEDGNNEKNQRRMTMRMTVVKRMTMTNGKWRGGVKDWEKLEKPEESTKSEQSEGEKVNLYWDLHWQQQWWGDKIKEGEEKRWDKGGWGRGDDTVGFSRNRDSIAPVQKIRRT